MPVPPMDVIESMGKNLIAEHDTSVQSCDKILRSFICETDRGSKRYFERIASAG